MPTGRIPIGRSEIEQTPKTQSIERRPKKRRIAPERVDIDEIKEVSLQKALQHHPVRVRVRHYPPPPPVLTEAGLLAQVGEDGPPSLVVGVVGPDEVGAGLGEVA